MLTPKQLRQLVAGRVVLPYPQSPLNPKHRRSRTPSPSLKLSDFSLKPVLPLPEEILGTRADQIPDNR